MHTFWNCDLSSNCCFLHVSTRLLASITTGLWTYEVINNIISVNICFLIITIRVNCFWWIGSCRSHVSTRLFPSTWIGLWTIFTKKKIRLIYYLSCPTRWKCDVGCIECFLHVSTRLRPIIFNGLWTIYNNHLNLIIKK